MATSSHPPGVGSYPDGYGSGPARDSSPFYFGRAIYWGCCAIVLCIIVFVWTMLMRVPGRTFRCELVPETIHESGGRVYADYIWCSCDGKDGLVIQADESCLYPTCRREVVEVCDYPLPCKISTTKTCLLCDLWDRYNTLKSTCVHWVPVSVWVQLGLLGTSLLCCCISLAQGCLERRRNRVGNAASTSEALAWASADQSGPAR